MDKGGSKRVKIFDITLRDGSQSKVATRIKLDDLLKVASKLADSGIYGAETWGGATFDVCVRYLREDPWERARKLKEVMPNVKSMMLIRGQNLVAYSNFPDDVVVKFVETAARNGIDVFIHRVQRLASRAGAGTYAASAAHPAQPWVAGASGRSLRAGFSSHLGVAGYQVRPRRHRRFQSGRRLEGAA